MSDELDLEYTATPTRKAAGFVVTWTLFPDTRYDRSALLGDLSTLLRRKGTRCVVVRMEVHE